jgi:hypothetical protein
MELGWAWGVTAYDYENDSDEDFLLFNGTETEIPPVNQMFSRGDKGFLDGRYYLSIFRNEANASLIQESGYFYDTGLKNPIAFKGNSRCGAAFDFDGDGDQDLAVINYDAKAMFFENLQEKDNNWIGIKLEGTKCNRNAIGAIVEIRFDDQRRFKQVVSRTGFLSQGTYQLHFGLGASAKVDEVIVKWPGGNEQTVSNLDAGNVHPIVQE